jgi:hypothetical protein
MRTHLYVANFIICVFTIPYGGSGFVRIQHPDRRRVVLEGLVDLMADPDH